jgi:hypothetical protein
MVFLFGSVLITVELPQLFGEKFHFNAQQLGYQFMGLVVGSVIGEQLGGSLSDYWMGRPKKDGSRHEPEHRLWLSYSGFLLTIVGLVVYLVQTDHAETWNITPVIGIAIAGVGTQLVTTVLITYAVDSHQEESASIGVFITFVRQIWGFIGPFWYVPIPNSLQALGLVRNRANYLSSQVPSHVHQRRRRKEQYRSNHAHPRRLRLPHNSSADFWPPMERRVQGYFTAGSRSSGAKRDSGDGCPGVEGVKKSTLHNMFLI